MVCDAHLTHVVLILAVLGEAPDLGDVVGGGAVATEEDLHRGAAGDPLLVLVIRCHLLQCEGWTYTCELH